MILRFCCYSQFFYNVTCLPKKQHTVQNYTIKLQGFMGKMESWRATLRNFNNDIQKKQEANKNCTAFYLNANINTVCYLEKNLMSAYGSEHRQGCHFVACVKWWEECYLKCYRQLRHRKWMVWLTAHVENWGSWSFAEIYAFEYFLHGGVSQTNGT